MEMKKKNDGRDFYKESPNDTCWWVNYADEQLGTLEVSFDKKKIYNLWTDYPEKFTATEKAIFDKENPYWAEFFAGRNE